MSERSNKIVIVPEEIRGWGNVLKEKANADFTKYKCSVSQSNTTIDGFSRHVFYVTGFMNTNLSFVLSPDGAYSVGESINMSVVLKNVRGTVLKNQSVKVYVNTLLKTTLTTNNNGEITYTFPFDETGAYTFKFVFDGSSTLGASSLSKKIFVGVNVNVTSPEAYYYEEDAATLVATVTSYGTDEVVPGCVVSFTLTEQANTSHVINSDAIVANNDGKATFARNITPGGWYDCVAKVSKTASDVYPLYIVDFPLEYNNMLLWLKDCLSLGRDGQYDSMVDLRYEWNALLADTVLGRTSDQEFWNDGNMVNRFNTVLTGMLAYLRGE